jgi:methylisocitrate lyase
MNAAALQVYQAIKQDGSQKNVVNIMQNRDDLYKHLNYYAYEQKLDQINNKAKGK